MKKVYLAGPEVFLPNAKDIGKRLKSSCKSHSFEGLFPLDSEITPSNIDVSIFLSKKEMAKEIAFGNMRLIEKSDYVFANLSNFRGTTTHPSCDSGTAWECGYAVSLGKTVIGYTTNLDSVPQEIANNIHLTVCVNETDPIGDIVSLLSKIKLKSKVTPTQTYIPKLPRKYCLDPVYDDILDANPVTSFYLGMRKGFHLSCSAFMKDMRPQLEKYGPVVNGYHTEDFGEPVNIMLSTTTIIHSTKKTR